MADPADLDGGVCDFCALEMDPTDLSSPCVRLHCPGCGQRLYHRDCVSTFLRRMKWRSETSAKAGLGAFPCPRGKGKIPLDENSQCKCRITILTTVIARSSKGEQKKAAKVAAMAQLQEQLKQQQAQKRAAQQAAKPQQQQKQQQQQQQWQPRVNPDAAVPQVSAALSARLAGPEQHEVPGMEFVPQKKPKARKRGAQGAAPGPATVAGAQGSQQAQGRVDAAGPSSSTTPAAGPSAQLNSNNWVSSLDAYNKLLAQLGAGSSDDEEDNNYNNSQRQQQQRRDGQGQGEGQLHPPPPTWESSAGGSIGLAEVEDEEDDGYAALQSVVGVLTALDVEVPPGSHTSPEWLQKVMEGLEQLQEQGYDVSSCKEIVQDQIQWCSGEGNSRDSSNQSSSGGAWDGNTSTPASHERQQQQQQQQQQLEEQQVLLQGAAAASPADASAAQPSAPEPAAYIAPAMPPTFGALPAPTPPQQVPSWPHTSMGMQALSPHQGGVRILPASQPQLQPGAAPSPLLPVVQGMPGTTMPAMAYDPLRFAALGPLPTTFNPMLTAAAPPSVMGAAMLPLGMGTVPPQPYLAAAPGYGPAGVQFLPPAFVGQAPAGPGLGVAAALPANFQQHGFATQAPGPAKGVGVALGGAVQGGAVANQQQQQEEEEDEDLAELLSLCLPAQA